MKIYVSGPISGLVDGNVSAFRTAEKFLREVGHDVVVPHDLSPYPHDGVCPPSYASGFGKGSDQHSSASCFLRADLVALLECEALYMLGGWERSVGARLEFEVGALCGFEIYYQSVKLVPEIS